MVQRLLAYFLCIPHFLSCRRGKRSHAFGTHLKAIRQAWTVMLMQDSSRFPHYTCLFLHPEVKICSIEILAFMSFHNISSKKSACTARKMPQAAQKISYSAAGACCRFLGGATGHPGWNQTGHKDVGINCPLKASWASNRSLQPAGDRMCMLGSEIGWAVHVVGRVSAVQPLETICSLHLSPENGYLNQ